MANLPHWLQHFLEAEHSAELWYQLVIIIGSGVSSYIVGRIPVNAIRSYIDNHPQHWYTILIRAIRRIIIPSLGLLAISLGKNLFKKFGLEFNLLSVALNLTLAWIAIRFCTVFTRRPALARWLALVAWGIAALNILGWLDIITKQLNGITFTLSNDKHVSLLTLLQGGITVILFVWGAIALSNFIEKRLRRARHMSPSMQVLLGKVFRIGLITTAFLFVLNTMGIDLTAFAVFGGAIGVGIGFGLQKVIANFISGIILLMDRSIKPGDVVGVGDTYGWVNALGARYVSVVTRDGREHLIPNELLITEKVENWSYSDTNIRLKIPVGISYNSDVKKAIDIMRNIIEKNPRILKNPEPNVLLMGFGDNSVNLEARAWISDPQNGTANITSDILLEIWEAFHRENIEIPFPQRDLHIKSVDKDAAKLLIGKKL